MRLLLTLIAFTAIFQSLATEPAEARRRGSSQQELHFVSPTKIPDSTGKLLSLCHLTNKRTILTLGLWLSSEGYALSDNKCLGEQYFAFTDEQFGEAQGAGLISADIPAKPNMTLSMIFDGFFGLAIIGLLLAFVAYKFIDSQRRKQMRHKGMGDVAPFDKSLLDVICHAALSDGTVDASEVTLIQKIAKDLTGREFSRDEIEGLVRSCDKKLSPAQFKAFGKKMDMPQKATFVKAALMVVSADNDLAETEQAFISGLVSGLGIPDDLLKSILAGE